MRIGTRPILLLHRNQQLHRALRALMGREYALHPVTSWEALAAELRCAPPAAIAVVDPQFPSEHHGGTAAVRSLVGEFASVPVIAALAVTPGSEADLVALSHAGIVDVIVLGHDDTSDAIRERLRLAHSRPLKVRLEGLLAPDAPGKTRAIMEAAADVVATGGCARDLAAALHMSRRTLERWARAAGLLAPRRLLAWLRILMAAHLLDDPGRTVLSASRASGYASDSGLRRVTSKLLRKTPTELRRGGRAFATAARVFVSKLDPAVVRDPAG